MSAGEEKSQRPWLRLAPLGVFLLLAGLFVARLFSGDPSKLPSALIGRPAPAFTLPAVEGLAGVSGFGDADLRQGHVSVINVFASWCAPCRAEAPTLLTLAHDETLKAAGVKLYGLSYKDDAANAVRFLTQEGNPFDAVGADSLGRTAIDFGVYGVPETFVVRGDGVVAYKFVGPLSPYALEKTLIPEIEKALKASAAPPS
ncbi:DsbE family thiol:disulfide interchange protein [Methylocystis bryophila]|uniref:Thiol:disulfide interchange protein n=1 Tax=Methylocystis bryophila TaxID=655015 RepID=A0A1W6MY91_9HYPH|nr:DsbE family thiol:disulfide interchange protein [Methylocystis bryophila]ARN82509.1 thiol:disulfide interchange protein [Methylocystis bryophila]BDV38706.1 thiol:disulfide interchange protein [Methylocystis bryophila]